MMPIGHDPDNRNDPANDGADTLPINAPEKWEPFIKDQWLWNGELGGWEPLAEEHDYPRPDPARDITDPMLSGEYAPDYWENQPAPRPHRIRRALARFFDEIGRSYPADQFYPPF